MSRSMRKPELRELVDLGAGVVTSKRLESLVPGLHAGTIEGDPLELNSLGLCLSFLQVNKGDML